MGSAIKPSSGGSSPLGTTTAAANPQRSGDATTGLLSLATTSVSIETGGVEALRITATGSVGIGTASPGYPLHVYTGSTLLQTRNQAAGTNSTVEQDYQTDSVLMQALANQYGGSIGTYTNNQFYLGTNNQPRLLITSGGSVGIGTTSPQAVLHVAGGAIVANDTASCTGTNQGEIKYVSNALYFCDGTAWRNIEWSAASSTTPIFMAGAGFLVMSAGTFNGNMGDLVGADADCYSDLTSNNWMGKSTASAAGILTTGHIHAWLCDSGGCGAPYGSTTYYFAISGDPSHGGATITTESDGNGGATGGDCNASDGNNWAATNYFNASYSWWSSMTSSCYAFAPQAAYPGYYQCNNWSDATASYLGLNGATGNTDLTRWFMTTSYCNNAEHLICIVQP